MVTITREEFNAIMDSTLNYIHNQSKLHASTRNYWHSMDNEDAQDRRLTERERINKALDETIEKINRLKELLASSDI